MTRDPESRSPYGVGNGPAPQRLELPWPHKSLSPNSRKDRRAVAGVRRAYKNACWALAKQAKFHASHLDITFHPPDGRRRDLDNMLASLKSGLDGVALAMGCDDSEWSLTIKKGAPRKPGCVVILAGSPIEIVEFRGVVE